MELLETHGFMVEYHGALEMLEDSGAQLDFEKQVVKVKSNLVEKCMSSTVSRIVLRARDPSKNVIIEIELYRALGALDLLYVT